MSGGGRPRDPMVVLRPHLEQMRRNGHWVLAKGVDFEATYRFKLHPHDFGLTVGPTVFEPSLKPPPRPTATIESDSITITRLFNAGLTLSEAESEGRLSIRGDRAAATALLDRFSLSDRCSRDHARLTARDLLGERSLASTKCRV